MIRRFPVFPRHFENGKMRPADWIKRENFDDSPMTSAKDVARRSSHAVKKYPKNTI